MRNAVVLLSGGQDSTTCLAWAMEQYAEVACVTIDYGQRHRVELACAAQIAKLWRVPQVVVPIDSLAALGGAALTDATIDVEAEASAGSRAAWAAQRGLPSTFVPGRNLLFFTLAAAWGLPRGYDTLVTGVCQADRAGYPDCRSSFVFAAELAVRLAMDAPEFRIAAPLLERSKAGTWRLADDLGVLEVVVNETHTCYRGDRAPVFEWGAGCGECPACDERARGFYEAFPANV